MKNFAPLFFIAVISVILASCGPHYTVKEYKEIKDGQWFYKDSLVYDFEISDTNKVYNLYLDVEHADTFGFENAYVILHTIFPNGKKLDQQLSLELANKTGIWNGECSSGKCKALIALQQGAFFNQEGKYKLTMEQFMRIDPVKGINKIGFLMEKTDVDKTSFLKGLKKKGRQ